MTSAQFVRLLERQERAESKSTPCAGREAGRGGVGNVARSRLLFEPAQAPAQAPGAPEEDGSKTKKKKRRITQTSFLDHDARMPFEKLKEVGRKKKLLAYLQFIFGKIVFENVFRFCQVFFPREPFLKNLVLDLRIYVLEEDDAFASCKDEIQFI